VNDVFFNELSVVLPKTDVALLPPNPVLGLVVVEPKMGAFPDTFCKAPKPPLELCDLNPESEPNELTCEPKELVTLVDVVVAGSAIGLFITNVGILVEEVLNILVFGVVVEGLVISDPNDVLLVSDPNLVFVALKKFVCGVVVVDPKLFDCVAAVVVVDGPNEPNVGALLVVLTLSNVDLFVDVCPNIITGVFASTPNENGFVVDVVVNAVDTVVEILAVELGLNKLLAVTDPNKLFFVLGAVTLVDGSEKGFDETIEEPKLKAVVVTADVT
jgi:hypothetical protein